MFQSLDYQSISPKKVIRGPNVWRNSIDSIHSICTKPIIIGGSKATKEIRNKIKNDLQNKGLLITSDELNYGCCEVDLIRLQQTATINNVDGVIAAGGGKTLDAGKLLADRLSIPCITVPLSAATCAGWTALANIYSPSGQFIRDKTLSSNPDLLIFNHSFVKKAPPRTLASGIADALAKWYESSIANKGSKDGLVQQAVQMSRVLRDQLFIDANQAFQNPNTEEWVRVAEGCALTAGLVGGIGGATCRTAAAHAVHNGLTQLSLKTKPLHGEIVGYGILVQLRLEEIIHNNQLARQSRLQLTPLLKILGLPTSLDELGLKNVSINELRAACDFATHERSEIHNLPFKINSQLLLETLIESNDQYKIKSSEQLEAINLDKLN